MRSPALFIALTLFASASVMPAQVFADTNNSGNSTDAAAKDPDQVIKCRKVEVTGSLVKKGRVCRTIAEWKRIQENGNRTARALADSGQVCAGGSCGNGN